ncbi:AMP-binding protein [Actinocrinis puniceicyclus]|uniref:AMP-binding protein n=1 Tax=Actinocrinis puniceicyclus TaxID=977794 RepID=A0A8J7WPP4_9ACTN|nr:AMP-binding protein [Actinocrinis puniceicyclus]MBS2963734.1 AMP-binding protein [Actinocrinis puniceicyclus]
MRLLPSLTSATADEPDAIRMAGRALTRAHLFDAAHAVAARITGAEAVAVHAAPGLETVVAVVAGLLAAVPVVPVPPDCGPAERDHVLRDSRSALLLAADADLWPDCGLEVVPVDAAARAPGHVSFPEPSPDSPALILYTSGTTGAPKGVPITARAIAADLDALADAWQWTAEDTLVHGLPLFHVHGLVLGVLGALRTGSRLVHTGRPNPAGYAAAASNESAPGTLYFGVPTVWARTCAEPAAARALASARLLVSGSAALPAPVFAELEALTGHRAVERYGMTETLITLSTRADDAGRQPGTVGRAVTGVTTRLVAEDGSPVAHDGKTVGELQVRGSTVFSGYLGRPDATTASFTHDDWFRTGDMAVIGADNIHRIVGRASTDLIKSGGYRIGAGEVENALLAHPAVREAAVIGVSDDDLGQRVAAFVVADGVTESDLIDFVARSLSAHKRPRAVTFVEGLPRNAMGKVRKDLLRR